MIDVRSQKNTDLIARLERQINPFLLDTPALLCFSTGRTSAFLLYKTIEAYGGVQGDKVDGSILPKDLIVSFQNTGEEREESLAFGYEVETRWNVPLIWLEWDDTFHIENYRGGAAVRRKNLEAGEGFRVVTFDTASRNGEPYKNMLQYYASYREMIGKGRVLPNAAQRMCTAHLKIKVSERYMKSLGYKEFDCSLGIRHDEPKRFSSMMAENDRASNPYYNVCPLFEEGLNKADVMRFWGYDAIQVGKEERYVKVSNPLGFDLMLDPASDEGNCNLCFLKKVSKIVRIMKQTDQYDSFWIEAEEFTGQVFRRDRPTYKELRRMINEDDEKLGEILSKSSNEQTIDCICGEPS